jgi:hypothetical protein
MPMPNARDDDQVEAPSGHPLREIVNHHPVAAVVTAFVIGLLLAKLAF